jgi:NAD(P)-dependent dehydrogenase (short-subunit alcohol dehydrogenase family)
MMLAGRTIVVTGVARGLGRAIALACAQAGATLLLGDVDTQSGGETADMVRAAGGTASFWPVDLADPHAIENFARHVEKSGVVHGLVNNAAIATGIGGITYDDIDIAVWDRVMQVNVRGTWLMTRAIAPLLAASGSGRIVNIASDTALWGAPRLMAYVASKGALMAMTRSLARELGESRVGVTAVAPGILTTESTEYVPQARHDLYAAGRAVTGPQAPEDVCGTICFLLSEPALALTGQTLPVNAGFVFN